MARVRVGFDSQRVEQERQDKDFVGSGKFIPFLRLVDDGDIAKIRVVTGRRPGETAEKGLHHTQVNGEFHRHEVPKQKGGMRWATTLCGLDRDEVTGELGGSCDLCDEGYRRTTQFLMWVWVEALYHRTQSANPKVQWKRGSLGEQPVFMEPVERFMVWQDGYFMTQLVEGKLQRFGTLTDRNYLVIRHGMKNTTKVTRELEGMDPTPLDADIVAKSAELPPLDKIADGTVTTMGQKVSNEDDPYAEESPESKRRYDEVLLDQAEVTAVEEDGIDDLPF